MWTHAVYHTLQAFSLEPENHHPPPQSFLFMSTMCWSRDLIYLTQMCSRWPQVWRHVCQQGEQLADVDWAVPRQEVDLPYLQQMAELKAPFSAQTKRQEIIKVGLKVKKNRLFCADFADWCCSKKGLPSTTKSYFSFLSVLIQSLLIWKAWGFNSWFYLIQAKFLLFYWDTVSFSTPGGSTFILLWRSGSLLCLVTAVSRHSYLDRFHGNNICVGPL